MVIRTLLAQVGATARTSVTPDDARGRCPTAVALATCRQRRNSAGRNREPSRCPAGARRGGPLPPLEGLVMFVPRIVVAVLAAAVLAGCAVGDTTRDSERIGGTGSVLGGTSTASSGSPTEQATDRALLRAGDLPDGYLTLDRQVLTTSDRSWGDPWGDDGLGRRRMPLAARRRHLTGRAVRPRVGTRPARRARRRRVRARRVRAVCHPRRRHLGRRVHRAGRRRRLADLADLCSVWDGDDSTGVRGDINVARRPPPTGSTTRPPCECTQPQTPASPSPSRPTSSPYAVAPPSPSSPTPGSTHAATTCASARSSRPSPHVSPPCPDRSTTASAGRRRRSDRRGTRSLGRGDPRPGRPR